MSPNFVPWMGNSGWKVVSATASETPSENTHNTRLFWHVLVSRFLTQFLGLTSQT